MNKWVTAASALCILLLGEGSANAVVHDITIGNFFFSPLGTVVQPGDTVRWTWMGSPSVTHNTTSDLSSPKTWASMTTNTAGFTFEQVFTQADGPGPFPYKCTVHPFTMIDTIFMAPGGCCVGSRGNVDGDPGDGVDVGDLTHLIAHLYVDGRPIDCEEEANINGDAGGIIDLADVSFMISHLFINFQPLPTCADSVPFVGVDLGTADTVRLSVVDTQTVGSDLVFGVQLWLFNDAQDVVGVDVGFNWNSPNIQINSIVVTNVASSAFNTIGSVPFNNTSREFQFVDFRLSGPGLVQSNNAKHIATYWMTYSNWTPADPIIFDTTRVGNAGYGFVGNDNRTWIPEFVSQGIAGVADTFSFTGTGSATVSDVGGVVTVSNIGQSGDDGVEIQVPSGEQFVGMNIGNIDLSIPDMSLTMDVNADFTPQVGSTLSVTPALPPQLVGAIGIATPGGAIQFSADFSAIGDPNVHIEVYNGPLLTGGASVAGGGVVAIGNDAGFGVPIVTSLTYSGTSPPGYTVELNRATRFTLTNGTILIGDKIRLLALNATGSIDLLNTINVKAAGIGFFTLTGVTTSSKGFCCLGFTGNINCDPSDLVDIADLTELIDHLFISFPPLCCAKEGNIDGDISATVDIADLTALIDFLFINFTPTSPCP